MGSFGQDLKKAREAKGVTLEAIAGATKITTRYLQAVEQEQFDKLPGGVFRRSISAATRVRRGWMKTPG